MLMIIFFVDKNLKNLPLSEILDIEKIKDVNKPIERANGLPNECYINNDYLAHEKERIFFDKWTVIGVASSIPNPGDAKPHNLLCLLYTSPSPRDAHESRMPSSA